MTEDVLIVARTERGEDYVCVGGVVLGREDSSSFLRSVRLLHPGGGWVRASSPYQVGDVFEVSFTDSPDRKITEPHVEDVYVTNADKKEHWDDDRIASFLRGHSSTFRGQGRWFEGSPDSIFGGALQPKHGDSGYIDQSKVPSVSTGFWIPDRNLSREIHFDDTKYRYGNARTGICLVKYKSTRESLNRVPNGTVCRVSLSGWWDGNGRYPEERCFLQLSDYYIDR